MIIIFHNLQPIGKLLIDRNTKPISIKRNGVLLYEDDDYSLREIENERELTIIQEFEGSENELVTIMQAAK